MKRKGFTLVELLAVIVILAVIALIAVPVVLNMIEEARIGSAEDSVYSYVKGIEDSIVAGYLSGNEFNAGEYKVGDIKVNIKGSTPTNGSYKLDDKNEVISGKFCINGYSIDYDGKYATRNKDVNYCNGTVVYGVTKIDPTEEDTHKGIVYLDPTDLTNTCTESIASLNKNDKGFTTGIKTGCMKWYIYDDSNDKYKMILDHNSTPLVAWNWNTDVNEGMKEVMDALNSDTANWDETIKSTARLISANEIAKIIGNTTFTGALVNTYNANDDRLVLRNDYYWLYDNLSDCEEFECQIEDDNEYVYQTQNGGTGHFELQGYWTSTPVKGEEYFAWEVSKFGWLDYIYRNYSERNGLRPIIEVSKDIFK